MAGNASKAAIFVIAADSFPHFPKLDALKGLVYARFMSNKSVFAFAFFFTTREGANASLLR